MAKKRMFSLGVLDTDAFLDMPLSAQALYFHLNLRADDDGFVGNPKRITQNVGANIDDLRLLVAKRFVLAFEDGVIVIKHWRMHNAIKKDRYTATNYTEDLKQLDIKDNGAYTMRPTTDVPQLERKWSTNGAQMEQTGSTDLDIEENSIDKNSSVKERTEEDSKGECEGEPAFLPAEKKKIGKYVMLTTHEYAELLRDLGTFEFMNRKKAVDLPENEGKDFYTLIRGAG